MLDLIFTGLIITIFFRIPPLGSISPLLASLHSPPGRLWPILAFTLLVTSGSAGATDDNSLFLVANPQLKDPRFKHSVVLITRHGNGGALGVIINRSPSTQSFPLSLEDDLHGNDDEVHYGGPVDPTTLMFLFRAPKPPTNALHLFDDVYISADRKLLGEQMRRPRGDSQLRLYAGYTAWAPGQLRKEVAHGNWSAVEASMEILFDTDLELIWETLSGKKINNWI